MNGKLVIRVGGGFMFIDEFLKLYAQAEINKLRGEDIESSHAGDEVPRDYEQSMRGTQSTVRGGAEDGRPGVAEDEEIIFEISKKGSTGQTGRLFGRDSKNYTGRNRDYAPPVDEKVKIVAHVKNNAARDYPAAHRYAKTPDHK
jgi:hypothetical protein